MQACYSSLWLLLTVSRPGWRQLLLARSTRFLAYASCLLAGLATSCEPAQDLDCPGRCTVLQGQLTLAGGTQPLANVPLEVVWSGASGFLGRVEHTKARGQSDEQGRYRFRFLLQEEEVRAGTLAIRYSVDESKYLVLESRPAAIYPDFAGPPRRDTVVTTDYRIARKAWVQARVSRSPGLDGHFSSTFLFPYGASSRGEYVDWLSPTAEFPLEVPGDVPIQVAMLHIRGAVRTETVDTLFVAAGQTLAYPVRF